MNLGMIDILYLPMLFFIGFITAREDYVTGKIRNKWIIIGLIYGAIILLGMLIWSLSARELLSASSIVRYFALNESREYHVVEAIYIYRVLLNSFIAIFLGFGLWRWGYMAAGDAKLFFVFTLLLPLKYYWKTYLPLFPSFSLLLNIFLPIFLYIFLVANWHFVQKITEINKTRPNIDIKKIKVEYLPKLFSFLNYLIGFAAIFIPVFYLRNLVSPYLPLALQNDAFLFLIFFLLRQYIYSLLKRKNLINALIIAIVIWQLRNIWSLGLKEAYDNLANILRMMVIFLVMIKVLQSLFDSYLDKKTTQIIEIKNLQPGMKPYLNKRPKPQIGKVAGTGITKEQVNMLKKWGEYTKFKQIEIYQKFPFAVWMLLGVIITIIFQGSIFNLILNYFTEIK